METYETKRVYTKKIQDNAKELEIIPLPDSGSNEQSLDVLHPTKPAPTFDVDIMKQQPTEEIVDITEQQAQLMTPHEPQTHDPPPGNKQNEQAIESEPTLTPHKQRKPRSTPTELNILHIVYEAWAARGFDRACTVPRTTKCKKDKKRLQGEIIMGRAERSNKEVRVGTRDQENSKNIEYAITTDAHRNRPWAL